MKIYNVIKKGCILVFLFATVSCNSWLDIDPEGVQTSDSYWQNKEEVESVIVGSYIQLRVCMPYFLKWGELRGNGIRFGGAHGQGSDHVTVSERNIKAMNIRPDNYYCQWSAVYDAIGRANSVIYFAPTALKNDVTYTQELCNANIAEAIFIRSLCYFYLVRTFKEVPLILEPYADDRQDFFIEKSSEDEVLEQLVKDLEFYKNKCKPGYEEAWQSKGRATSWAIRALLADIYLWKGDYANVLKTLDAFDNSGFELVERDEWMSIYYPGNSEESIFELQYDYNIKEQQNDLFDWFWKHDRYLVSLDTRDLFEKENQEEDIRGLKSGYTTDGNASVQERIWKYGGTENMEDNPSGKVRIGERPSPNFIFYRYADVLLMRAEAMVMQGNVSEAFQLLEETIRKRAGLTANLPNTTSEMEALTVVMKERQKEFLAEGKRWFDILRMAKRNDYRYLDYLKTICLDGISAKDRPTWRIKLNDPYCHYMPIHKDEILASKKILTQNPFYKDME